MSFRISIILVLIISLCSAEQINHPSIMDKLNLKKQKTEESIQKIDKEVFLRLNQLITCNVSKLILGDKQGNEMIEVRTSFACKIDISNMSKIEGLFLSEDGKRISFKEDTDFYIDRFESHFKDVAEKSVIRISFTNTDGSLNEKYYRNIPIFRNGQDYIRTADFFETYSNNTSSAMVSKDDSKNITTSPIIQIKGIDGIYHTLKIDQSLKI